MNEKVGSDCIRNFDNSPGIEILKGVDNTGLSMGDGEPRKISERRRDEGE